VASLTLGSNGRNELVEQAKGKATRALFKIIPYGFQVLASAAAYTLGITATQVTLFSSPQAADILGWGWS
jgi:hypothetical protein